MKNYFPSEIEEDISIILNPLKSSYDLEKELSIDQLSTYLSINKAYADEIIEGIFKFFNIEKTTIEENYFYKVLSSFLNKLEENNLSQISFLNKLFPVLMDKVYNFKNRKIKDENKLFNTISEFIKKLGNNVGQIEYHLNIIFDKLNKDDFEFDINNKYALITVLKTFLQSSPNISFYKIMKATGEFKKIIYNFKNKNKIIRKSVQKLIEEFLLILFNKEDNLRIEQSEKIIYDVCIKDYLDLLNISEFTKHGLILVLNSFAVQNPKNEGHLNEFFKEKYKIFLEYLYSNLNNDNNVIKIAVIRTLTKYCKLFPYLMEKTEQENNFSKILSTFIDDYYMIILSEGNEEDKTNTEILKAFGILSLIPEYNTIFSENINTILELIFREISVCKTFNDGLLDCLSNIITNYSDKFKEKFNFELYYKKLFKNGLRESHINFINKLFKLYPKNTKENIQITICILNVISFIITQRQFNFKFSQKKFLIISKEIKDENKYELNIKSESNEYPKFSHFKSLHLTKTISAPLNDGISNLDLQKYNKVGKLIKEYK